MTPAVRVNVTNCGRYIADDARQNATSWDEEQQQQEGDGSTTGAIRR
jgi:hypothetical protein